MPTVVSYDISKEKQTEFKEWLIKNKDWKDKDKDSSNADQELPASTLIKPSSSNPNRDVHEAEADLNAAAQAVGTEIEKAIIVSTGGALKVFGIPQERYKKLFK